MRFKKGDLVKMKHPKFIDTSLYKNEDICISDINRHISSQLNIFNCEPNDYKVVIIFKNEDLLKIKNNINKNCMYMYPFEIEKYIIIDLPDELFTM